MPRHVLSLLLTPLIVAGCASTGGEPSLAPRAAEAIDPRIPVVDSSASLAPDPQLVEALVAIRNRALAAAGQAEPAIASAAGLVGGAGAPESESWIVAQQAVSAAIAARAPFTQALGDLDRLITQRVRSSGRLVPRDLAAADAVSAELSAIDRRQAEAIAALQRKLG